MASMGLLGMSQRSQRNAYYCGPATGQEILKYLDGVGPDGETVTQLNLAAHCEPGYLCTDSLGETPWNAGSSYGHANGYVMTSTLNHWTPGAWYTTVRGTDENEQQYENNLVFSIDHVHPIAILVQEKPNAGPHLPGHPVNRTIGHWIAASGYSEYGAKTYYADSVHGVANSTISWAGDVTEPFYFFSSTKMYTLFEPRGYIF